MSIPLGLERAPEHSRGRDDSTIPRLDGIGRRIVIATHRRSGTHLAIDLLRRHFAACQARKRPGEGLDTLYLNLDRIGAPRQPLDEARAKALLARAERPIVKTHDLSHYCAEEGPGARFAAAVLEDADLYCVHRDGRDVLCSLFAYTRSHDSNAPATLSEFLRETVRGRSRVRSWAKNVRACLAIPGVRALAYEAMVRDTAGVVARFARELDLTPLPIEPALPRPVRSRWESRLRRLFATRSEGTSIPGHRWGHRPPVWRRDFTPSDRRFFRDEAGDLLIDLGYEDSDAWVEGESA